MDASQSARELGFVLFNNEKIKVWHPSMYPTLFQMLTAVSHFLSKASAIKLNSQHEELHNELNGAKQLHK